VVAPAIPPTGGVAPAKRSTWWIVPLVIVGLVLVAWLLLAGLPFGRDRRVVATATTETIAEGTASPQPEPTGTLVEVGQDDEIPLETETAPPAVVTQTTPPVTQTEAPAPAPVVVEERRPPVTPAPVRQPPAPRPQPAPQPAPARAELSEDEAASVLRGHLGSNNPYDVSADCLQVRGAGYRNVGYGFSVWDACVSGGGSRMLGRWRVDAKTREVFRQRDDGRYLRP
jgi:hypothetical protein